jgi:iron complex outermembrane receptor protein
MIPREVANRIARAVVIALGAGWVQGVYADTPADNDSGDQLPEVLVTATKRATNVQETAASITAVSADDIAERGLVDFNSLAQSVPGIAMRTAGPGQTEFEMRGLSSSGGNTSMVGFYLDEAPLSSPASAQLGKVVIDPNLYDLNRVEVLRGPQGTLYGASSMGGTVKLVPNAPQLGSFNASGEDVTSYTGSGGSINHQESGMVNLPFGDTMALRIVGSTTSDSGWIKRLVIQDGAVNVDAGPVFPNVSRPSNFYTAPLQEEVDGANTTSVDSVRATLLWKPTDNLSITPMVMWQLTQQGAPNAVDVNGDPTNPTLPSTLAHWEIYDTPEPQRDRFTLASLKFEYQLQPFSITSATAFWNRGSLVSQDGSEENAAAIGVPNYDAAAGGIGPTGPAPNGSGVTERDYTRQISEELRLTSSGSGPLQWIAGYFYQDLNSEWDMWSITPQATPVIGGTDIYVDYQPQTITQNSQFGEISYQFMPDLKATVGLRHYHYSLSQSNSEWGLFTVYAAQGNTVPYNTANSESASGTNPKFDLSYNLTQDSLVYATASKGFRLGGVNQPIPVSYYSPNPVNSVLSGNECSLQQKLLNIPATACSTSLLLQAPGTFSSDSVWNYEVGEKSAFFDRRLIANVSAYFERWTNPQISTNLAGFGITANGGDARIVGLEAELQAILSHDWSFTGNAGYTDAKFTENSAITGFPDGYAIPDTPKVTAAANLRWKHEITDKMSLTGSLEGNFVGSRTNQPYGQTITLENINTILVHLPSYQLFNLRFGPTGDNWTAMLFVTNLLNKETLLDPQPQINLQTAAFMRYIVNQPRTVGVDVTYKFH